MNFCISPDMVVRPVYALGQELQAALSHHRLGPPSTRSGKVLPPKQSVGTAQTLTLTGIATPATTMMILMRTCSRDDGRAWLLPSLHTGNESTPSSG